MAPSICARTLAHLTIPPYLQEVDVYGLPVNAPANQNKVRSYLASQGGDVDILRNLRGNSLDTLSSVQRQLAGLPPQVRRMTHREQIMDPHFGTVRLWHQIVMFWMLHQALAMEVNHNGVLV